MPMNNSRIDRARLTQFLPDPRAVREFDNIQNDVSNMGDALTNASFLTINTELSLGSERALQVNAGQLTAVDGGANNSFTLGLAATTVVPASYGDATHLAAFTVDAKGRLTAASAILLNSDNVTEGGTNLYFTTARARGAFSVFAPLAYNATTGVFSLLDTAVSPATYGDATHLSQFTVDQKGRLTAAGSFVLNSDNVTEGATNLFYTTARVRASFSGSTGITYTGASGTIALDTTNTRNIDHASISVTAGTGLTGGGDLTATRTIALAAIAGVAGVHVSPTSITVDAYGRITAITP